jgi:hypothetical protein
VPADGPDDAVVPEADPGASEPDWLAADPDPAPPKRRDPPELIRMSEARADPPGYRDDDGTGDFGKPDQVEFWKRAEVIMAKGIARPRIGQLVNLLSCDWQRGFGIIADTAKAKNPSSYFGAIIRNLQVEHGGTPPPPKRAKGEPEWVARRRAEGAFVEREGPNRWRDCGILHDDEGREVGW